MQKLPKLQFPPIRLRGRQMADGDRVWDEVRSQWVVLTPEEWVRRHLAAFLVSHCGADRLRMVEEYPVPMNGQLQRADLVVTDGAGAPLLLAECKAPDVGIDRAVLDQAVRYNSVLQARFIVLTNGLKHYCYEVQGEILSPLATFPRLE